MSSRENATSLDARREHAVSDTPLLIGIDCAAQTSTLGLARAELTGDGLLVSGVCSEKYTHKIDEKISEWVKHCGSRGCLLALDSPLGWPAPMGHALVGHAAGEATQPSEAFLGANEVGRAANLLFRRNTDYVVEEHLKTPKRTSRPPFDVGADKIARVAHASLCFLARLRVALKIDIPLAWEPGAVDGVQVMEVYPAATLRVHGLMVEGYKSDKPKLRDICKKLEREGVVQFETEGDRSEALKTDHALDAVVCCLAAADFVSRNVIRPRKHERTLAEKEGWIWVARQKRQSKKRSAI